MNIFLISALSKGFKRVFACRLSALSSVLLLLTFLFVACGSIELNSNFRDREITIDGKNNDWLGTMLYFEKERISLGLLNDEDFMYICLIAEDQFIRSQVMRQGLTLWFDPAGGKKRVFGIKFPLGMQEIEMQERGVPMKKRRDGMDPERFRQVLRGQTDELEILGPRKDESIKMPVDEAQGIDIKLRASSGMLVYELKVPLLQNGQHPFAIGAKAGSSIGIRLETPKIKRRNMRRGMAGGMGMPGGGRGGGMGGMRRGGMRFQMPKPLKVRINVKLASGSDTVQE